MKSEDLEGKPEAIKEKMVEGRVNTTFKEKILLDRRHQGRLHDRRGLPSRATSPFGVQHPGRAVRHVPSLTDVACADAVLKDWGKCFRAVVSNRCLVVGMGTKSASASVRALVPGCWGWERPSRAARCVRSRGRARCGLGACWSCLVANVASWALGDRYVARCISCEKITMSVRACAC